MLRGGAVWHAMITTAVVLSAPRVLPAEGQAGAGAAQMTVGVVLPLTGGSSAIGGCVKNSIELAARRFDPAGRVRFRFEDDQLRAALTVSAGRALLAERISALVVYGTPTSLAAAPLAEQAHVPMVALSVLDRVVAGRRYVFKHWVPAEAENTLVVNEVRRRGYKSIAAVAMSNDAMLALRDLFVKSAAARVTVNEELPPGDLDFQSIITRIQAAAPDAVYNLLWPPQPGLFSRRLREAGYAGVIFGAHNLEDRSELAAAGRALSGGWFVTGDDRAGSAYYAEYRQRFGAEPTAGGINGYDVAKMLIEAPGAADLTVYLNTLRGFHGAYGEYGASGRHDFTIWAAVKEISG